jgi:phosphoserine phosphatase
MTKPRLIVFDLCNTLYDENTTFGFVRFFHARCGHIRTERWLATMLSRSSPIYYALAVVHRLFRFDLSRRLAIRTLEGHPEVALRAAASAYAAERLPGRANDPLHDALARHRAGGDRVVLVSNSLDIVVKPIADVLGVEWRASCLGFANGNCTGRIKTDLTGRKHAVVDALRLDAAAASSLWVYTDNLSDRALVACADRATVVIPRGSSRTRWGKVDAEFLEL